MVPKQPEAEKPVWYEPLLPHADFLPIGFDKRPAVRYSRATKDLAQIQRWQEQRRIGGIAAKLAQGGSLVVVDLDSAEKHPGAPAGNTSTSASRPEL